MAPSEHATQSRSLLPTCRRARQPACLLRTSLMPEAFGKESIPMSNCIAQTQSRVVRPSGEEGLYTISVSMPIQQKTGGYGCPVSLPDAIQPRIIYGEDSLQSLSLAMRFAADRIDDLISKGWKFYFGDSDDRFPFEAYFLPAACTEKLEAIAKQAEQRGDANPAKLGGSS